MNKMIRRLQRSLHFWDTNHITDAYPRTALAKFDADAYVRTAKQEGFSAVFFSAKDLWGRHFYPAKAGPVYKRCQPDTFGKVARACHKHDVALVAYYCVAFDRDAADTHPDWRMLTYEGKPVSGYDVMISCRNSPYLEERVLPALREITRKYRPAAFWLDHVWGIEQNCCWCKYCRKAYQEETGRRAPKSPKDRGIKEYQDWLRHRPELWARKMTGAIHEIDPAVVPMVNYAFTIRYPYPRPDWCRLISLDVWEPRDCIHLINPIHARWLSSMKTPWQFMITNKSNWWSDWNPKPLEELYYQLGVILAHGGGVCLGDIIMPDGSDSHPGRKRCHVEGLKWLKRHSIPAAEDAEPFRDIAILHSIAGFEAQPTTGDVFSRKPLLSVFGAARIFIDHHIDADIVNEPMMEMNLERYRVIILPEIAALDSSTVQRLAEFVSKGGALLASGALPFTSERLARLFGVKKSAKRMEQEHLWYADVSSARLGKRLEYEAPMSFGNVVWKPALAGGKALGNIIAPCPGFSKDAFPRSISLPPPDMPTSYPAIISHRVGKGRCLWINGELCAEYWRTSLRGLSHLLADLVARLHPGRILSVRHGGPLEFSLLRKKNRFFLHMVNFAAERHPARSADIREAANIAHITEPVPVRNVDVTLRLPSPAKEAYLHPGKKRIPLSRRGRTVSLTVPEVTDHAVLEVVTHSPAHLIQRVTRES